MRSFYNSYYFRSVAFALFFFHTNFANTQSFYIKQYTVNDGLPASYILSVFQDSKGFLWLGTFNGLSRFDGKEFLNYGYENGMPHIIADAIFEDDHHRLWIGTRNGMAEVKGHQCIVYPWEDKVQINFVFKFYQTKSGSLWALTSKGVYQFEKNRWIKVKLYPGFEDHACRDVMESDDEEMLINYGHHLVRKNKDGHCKLIAQLNQDNATGPFFSELYQRNGTFYLNRIDGFYEIKGQDTTAIFKDELRNKYILHTYKDRLGRFWIFTDDNQLTVSAPGNNQQFFYKKTIRLVSSFCEDREGNMWVACSNGLVKMNIASYESYEASFAPPLTGSCNVINATDNRLLVSAANNNLFSISPGNKAGLKKYPVRQSRRHYEIIDYWCNDETGRTWLTFREDRDLSILQKNQLKFLNGLVQGNVHPLTGVAYSKQRQELYVCADTFQCGNENKLHAFKSANGGRELLQPICAHCFSDGCLLVGTRNDGFFIIDQHENIFPVSKQEMSNHDAVASTRIFDDPSADRFWIASSSGLVRYRWQDKLKPAKDLEITSQQGLPNNGVTSIAFDNYKRIWAATLSGILVIEIDSLLNNSICVNLLSEEQGISSEYWMEARLAKDLDGNIWAGLTNQLLKFDPSKVQFEKTRPPVVISNVRLNSEETNWSQWTDSLEGIMQVPYRPALPYNKNTIGISYKAIFFNYTSAPEYSYRLMGSDSNWNVSPSNFVLLVNLSPGNYNFQVRARKSNGEWSEPAAFSFTIKKPYWATAWFRGLVVLVMAAIAYSFYRYRINQLKKLLEVRTKISRDLHDEIGSTLSGIGLLSEVAIQQIDNERKVEAKKFLQKVSDSSEEMLEKISDIVWAVNPQNDSFEKVIKRLKTYAKTTTDPLGIQLHFNSNKKILPAALDMQKRKNIYLICKEAINNAIKYSECRNLTFELDQQNHEISIYIADDGKGFDVQDEFDGNGLKNIKARAREIKARLKLESERGKGTSLRFFVKIT